MVKRKSQSETRARVCVCVRAISPLGWYSPEDEPYATPMSGRNCGFRDPESKEDPPDGVGRESETRLRSPKACPIFPAVPGSATFLLRKRVLPGALRRIPAARRGFSRCFARISPRRGSRRR